MPDTETEHWVPLYGPDHATIGRAKISGGEILMEVDDPAYLELVKQNLVGFSSVILDEDRADDILQKGENDER